MNLYLVRHGITAWNLAGRYQGWADLDLLPEGVSQARRTAAFFATKAAQQGVIFQAIYSSPLRRAWHTAQIIGDWLGMEPIALPDLREMHGGEIEGLTEAEWQARYPDHVIGWRDADNLDFGWPGGETRREFQARAVQAITALARRHSTAQDVIVVTHGGLIKAYLTAAGLADANGRRGGDVANCSVTQVQLVPAGADTRTGWSLSCVSMFNSVYHLHEPVGGPAPTYI